MLNFNRFFNISLFALLLTSCQSGQPDADNDVDNKPLINISVNAVDEGDEESSNNLEFSITLDSVSTDDVVFDYVVSDGTATAGSDYTATSGTLTISAGESSETINVAIIGDTVVELDETVKLTLSNISHADFGEREIFGSINNDDSYDVETSPEATIPASLESYSTINSIGMEWDISGDVNHNARCSVQYRILGTSIWNNAHPLYRVDFQGENMFAGSLLFLDEETEYEVKLELSDPDGGAEIRTEIVSTKVIPQIYAGIDSNTYHVVPGSGGGDGSVGNPFLGVDAAEAVLQPGDTCLLHGGNYGGVIYFDSDGSEDKHILWRAAGDEDAIFEGIRVQADYIWLEGITVVNQPYGIRTSSPGPKGVVIKGSTFDNNHYAIYLNDGGEGWYIVDNTIVGDNDPDDSNFSGEGIELWHTDGHTVAYNTISRVADGISYPGRNVDMYGNDIFDTSDDGIEFDYGYANNRAWKNRITNALNNGISFQPMNGSPYYVLYNQVSVLGSQNVLKLRDRSDRALIAHNTFIIDEGPMSSGSEYLINFEMKNNLWISLNDRYSWENGSSGDSNWKTDFDYDGFDWGSYPYAFKWGSDVRLENIADLYDLTGQEEHGIAIDHTTCFESLDYVEDSGDVLSYDIQYNTLNTGCNAVNAGVSLPGINDGFLGDDPDLGAYEVGKDLPHYGARSL